MLDLVTVRKKFCVEMKSDWFVKVFKIIFISHINVTTFELPQIFVKVMPNITHKNLSYKLTAY